MLTLVLLLIFLVVLGLSWFQGLWNNLLTLINVLFAAMIAVSFYEPIATAIANQEASFTYLYDFLIMWGLFAISLILFRLISEFASLERVKFIMPIEMAGRTILAIWLAWIVICFTTMTLHTAPVQSTPFGGAFASSNAGVFLGMAPDRLWVGFMRSRSTGVFAGSDTFDEGKTWTAKHFHRRKNFEGEEEFRVRASE
ncbi:MAG: hypothetical protein QGG36_32085 [Pirellulaceae bacterium]|jgi:hypothetical protein|nr:hypothetical protein [Pirellulaceae bacterium]MDP7020483.1 hypothetical protein [Pirellulaceae bacterium]